MNLWWVVIGLGIVALIVIVVWSMVSKRHKAGHHAGTRAPAGPTAKAGDAIPTPAADANGVKSPSQAAASEAHLTATPPETESEPPPKVEVHTDNKPDRHKIGD